MGDSIEGRIASLHLHPRIPGEPLCEVPFMDLEEQKGIANNPRYYDRTARDGMPGRRQISLIEREQIQAHAIALGLFEIPPGRVRSNIETFGIDLVPWVGREMEIGEARLLITTPRDPCQKMDAICKGLRALMSNGRQGVLAQVLRGGRIRAGDTIRLLR